MRFVTVLLLMALLCHCHALRRLGHRSKPAADHAEDNAPQALGTIEMVHPESGFVLARLTTNLAIPAGTELFTLDAAGGTVNLKLTPERKGVLVTADIVSGEPVKDGILFIGKAPSGSGTQPTAGPASAVNPAGGISITPGALGTPGGTMSPINTLPDSVAPGDSAADFLRIVPKQ